MNFYQTVASHHRRHNILVLTTPLYKRKRRVRLISTHGRNSNERIMGKEMEMLIITTMCLVTRVVAIIHHSVGAVRGLLMSIIMTTILTWTQTLNKSNFTTPHWAKILIMLITTTLQHTRVSNWATTWSKW